MRPFWTMNRWQGALASKRAVHLAIISGIYLILCAVVAGIAPELWILPQVSSWNLLTGLSFGLVLGCGLRYTPAVFLAHASLTSGLSSDAIGLGQRIFAAAMVSALFALTAKSLQQFLRSTHLDLSNRRHLAALFLVIPTASISLCALLTIQSVYTGSVDMDHFSNILMRGSVGYISGMLLITPCILLGAGWLERRLDRISGTVVETRGMAVFPFEFTWRSAVLWLALSGTFFLVLNVSSPDSFLMFCLISLPLVAVALRFGLHGTAPALVVLAAAAIAKAEIGSTEIGTEFVVIVAAVNGIGAASFVSEGHQQRTAMKRQAALLNSVSFATQKLLGLTDREKNVNEVLRQLAAEAGVSRLYVVENRPGQEAYPTIYEGSESPTLTEEQYSQVNTIRAKQIRLRAATLGQDKALQFRTADLPEDEQAILSAAGIHVGIILPIFADGRWWGCLSLDQCSTDRLWSELEVSAFKATAHVLGALLAHNNVEQQFRQFTGNIPAVFWIASPNALSKTYVSPAYEKVWGRSQDSIFEKPESWIGAIYQDDYLKFRSAIEKSSDGEYDEEYRIVRPDRQVRWIRDTAFPVRDASGQVSRLVGIAQDITPQKEAEERLRATSLLLSTLIDNLPVGIVVEDYSRQVTHVNQAFCRMFDVRDPRETLFGGDSRQIFEQHQVDGKRLDEIIDEGIVCRGEEIITKDGRVFSRDYIPFSVDGGCHHLWQYEDITDRKRNEERIQTSLKEKVVLLKEIHHRVKNNLQIISSLLNLQSMQIRDQQTAQVFRDSQSRVRAMALVHERLYQSADLALIDFAGYVEDVTHHLLRSYQNSQRAVRLKLEVDPVSLNIDTAIPCALIINELVSNSLKYAFPGNRPGEIRIRLVQERNDDLNLVISDDGVGFPNGVSFETTDSLGLQLVRSLADQLNGKIDYRNHRGTEFDIKFRALTNDNRN